MEETIIAQALQTQALYGFLVVIFVVLMMFLGIALIFSKRKTKRYRIELADMYVASKIRQIADKENVDLGKEYQQFRLWNKKNKLEEGYYGFDDVVEEDLKEKLNLVLIDKKSTDKK